jgi:hypothetical protein
MLSSGVSFIFPSFPESSLDLFGHLFPSKGVSEHLGGHRVAKGPEVPLGVFAVDRKVCCQPLGWIGEEIGDALE